jgi:xylonate dehydratase
MTKRVSSDDPETASVLGGADVLRNIRLEGDGPQGSLPITSDSLLKKPSGHLFGLTQNAGMGWRASDVMRDPYLILSTLGGSRKANGEPLALGYHTGHWELGLLIEQAAVTAAPKAPWGCSTACPTATTRQ